MASLSNWRTFFSFALALLLQDSLWEASFATAYHTRAGPVNGKINVHLVAHTHDDVGWLKTVDQYYIGSNNSIQVAAVQYILDSVVEKLADNADRKFIYVEMAFFQRWWREQTRSKQKLVRRLVESGQLEFINGGWCMHDEATTHYIDMIDQTTLGHRYIKETFGKVPRVAWQLDPFGHSAVQGYLLTAEAGFEAVFFSRADWQDVAKRRKERTMEFIWRGSDSLGSSAQVFGGAMHHHYDPPEGFRYDIANPDPPIQDDELLYDVNVDERVEAFVQAVQDQAAQFRTDHIMWAMGEDFAYANAQTWFKNMDKLIHYVNKDGRVNAFYSTPSMYVDSKYDAGETWPIKRGDFFPYADSPHNFWTGYFTSRPTVKGYVRSLAGYLQAARQLEVFAGRQHHRHHHQKHTTDALEEAMAVAQHHDAVSGTEKQHVSDDYVLRLHIGELEARKVFSSAIRELLSAPKGHLPRHSDTSVRDEVGVTELDGSKMIQLNAEADFTRCPLLNISYCPISETDLSGGKTLVVVVYNSLGWTQKEYVRFTVSDPNVVVKSSDGTVVASQVSSSTLISASTRDFYVRAHLGDLPTSTNEKYYQLLFEADVPPLGFSTYHVTAGNSSSPGLASWSVEAEVEEADNDLLVISSDHAQLSFSTISGQLHEITSRTKQFAAKLKQGFYWYNASNGIEAGPQASGAYVFRPNSSDPYPLPKNGQAKLKTVRGPLMEEVHQTFDTWASQVVRMYKNDDFAEVTFKVGPIPIDDDFGKEIITKLETDLDSEKTFYTDSNGRDYLKRVVDYRDDWDINVTDPVAGNYYPVNSGIYISDGEVDFSVLVDRSVGASSLQDGEVEVMLHRRLLYDDNKGVAEPLNETVCVGSPPKCEGLSVTGTYYISLKPKGEAARWRRTQTQKVLSPLQLTFSIVEGPEADTWRNTYQGSFSAVAKGYELPPNVALITLQELHNGKILLRLAHLYETGEDEEYSTIARVDLKNLFPHSKILHVVELSLTANQLRKDVRRLEWKVEDSGEEAGKEAPPLRGSPHEPGSTILELAPMEIRTFRLTLGQHKHKHMKAAERAPA